MSILCENLSLTLLRILQFSKLIVKLTILPAANIEYLFWLIQLIKKSKIVKHVDKIPKKSKLYSISHIDIEGAHIKFIQNK